MGSQVQGSEGPRGQIDVRGHHLPNGGRGRRWVGRLLELVIMGWTEPGSPAACRRHPFTHAAVLVSR